MKVFDPASERRLLDRNVRLYLGFDFEEFRSQGALASRGSGLLIMGVYCLLVAYDDPADQLLKLAFDWVSIGKALRSNESRAARERPPLRGVQELALESVREPRV